MKIRTSFVSNSSSASYVIDCHISKAELVKLLSTALDVSSKEQIVSLIKRELAEQEQEWLENEQDRNEHDRQYGMNLKEMHEDRLKTIRKARAHFSNHKLDIETAILDYADYLGIVTTIFEDLIEISAFTVMHNSHTEGVPDIMKNIVTELAFNNQGRFTTRTVDHN